MPEQVNGFSKKRKNEFEIVYVNDTDGSAVMAAKNDGEWTVLAYPAGADSPGSTETELATGLEGEDEAMAVLVDYMENYEPEAVPDAPESVGVFEKTTDREREIVYVSEVDDTAVSVTRDDDTIDTTGRWTATAQSPAGSVQLAEFTSASAALDAAVEYMDDYDPDGDRPEADEALDELPDPADDQSGGGVLSGLGSGQSGGGVLSELADAGRRATEGVTAALSGPASPDNDDGADDGGDGDGDDEDGDGASRGALFAGEDRDRSGPTALERLSEDRDRSGPTALERLSEDRDRRGSSALFDDTMRGGDTPSVFDQMGRDRDGPSVFDQMEQDRGTPSVFDQMEQDRGTPSVFDQMSRDRDGPSVFDQMSRDRDGPSVFDQMSRDRDGPSVFDELGTDEDTADRLERLQNAEDSNDLYGGNR